MVKQFTSRNKFKCSTRSRETETWLDELLQINRDFDPSLSWHPKLQSLDLKRNYYDLERKTYAK